MRFFRQPVVVAASIALALIVAMALLAFAAPTGPLLVFRDCTGDPTPPVICAQTSQDFANN